MKQQTKIVLAIILALLLGTAFGFKIEEQGYLIHMKATELNFIGQSLQGIKQTISTSDIPSKQGFDINARIDSIVRIFNKGISSDRVVLPKDSLSKLKTKPLSKKDTTKKVR